MRTEKYEVWLSYNETEECYTLKKMNYSRIFNNSTTTSISLKEFKTDLM